MGLIRKDVNFRSLEKKRWHKVRVLVDTGASFSLLPSDLAKRIGLDPSEKQFKVQLANGRAIRVGADTGVVRIDGRQAPATIMIGDAAEPLLGAETLEALGVSIDMKHGRFVPTRSYAIRLG